MAKLNKQEVNAIANKLHRELSKKAEETKQQAMRDYIPSEVYSKVKTLLEKRDQISAEQARLIKEYNEALNKANEICPFWIYSNDNAQETLYKIVKRECQLPDIPTVEELKDEVTIAAIDDDFDTDSYIEKQLIKFK